MMFKSTPILLVRVGGHVELNIIGGILDVKCTRRIRVLSNIMPEGLGAGLYQEVWRYMSSELVKAVTGLSIAVILYYSRKLEQNPSRRDLQSRLQKGFKK